MKSSPHSILTVSIAAFLAALPLAPSASAAEVGYGLEAAKQNMGTFKTAAGLEATLFAAEPMIQNPTNIDIDHAGRVWAIEAVNYRLSLHKNWEELQPEGDRVVILEDTNSDGLADKETTFFQDTKLRAPLGILVLPGPGGAKAGTQVIVSAAPNVWLLTDTNGDDKADQSEILLKVGGNWDHDHQVHAFVTGPDGKLYFNFGNEGRKLTWPDGTTVVDLAGNKIDDGGKPYRQGMVFRCDLKDGKLQNIETLGWNFRNNYEVCVDSFGSMWQSDNDDDGNKGVRINYVMQYGNYGFTDEMTGAGWQTKRTNLESETPLRHWHLNDPGVVPNLLQTGGGSPTGILINEGAALGKLFENQLIHCDAGPRTVRAYPVKDDGAGYKAEMVDVLTSSDNWYRPSDVAIAPDGSLFVADWYDPGVGGHNMGDREKGKVRGRIYRVAAPGTKLTVPKADFTTASGSVAALTSPNETTQHLAWQQLQTFGAKAEPELQSVWLTGTPQHRARALQLLARLPAEGAVLASHSSNGAKYVELAITRNEPNLRIAGLRIARELKLDLLPVIKKLANDPSPQVRRECALLLRGDKSTEAAKLWVQLAQQHDGKDRWYLEALGIGAAGQDDRFFEEWLAAVGDRWNTPSKRDIVWRLRSAKSARSLATLIADPAVPEAEKPRYLRAFDFLPATPEKNQALIRLTALGKNSDTIAAEAMSRLRTVDLNANPDVRSALETMLAASRGTQRFVDLVRDFKMKGQEAGLMEFILKHPGTPEAGEATKLLLEGNAANAVVEALRGPDAVRLVEALGNLAEKRVVPILLPIVKDTNAAPELRKAAVTALARGTAGTEALLKLAREGTFPAELKLAASNALALIQQPALKNDILQFFPPPNAAGGQPLPPIMELAKL
ncbi:MAG TPA: PVC-type heme-binding CxxCH protein, partial [Chthoniobacteraceae bacterium]|nr:PVC-type heme-binding CxxCH protein [Chthoniobacteraceae bacterium]